MKISSSSLLLACLVSLGATAHDVRERSDLGLMQRQVTLIELFANRARIETADAAEVRYRFDYSRFAADLARVRQGIQKYLSPARAQPADLVELTSQYRAEAPHTSYSDEHD